MHPSIISLFGVFTIVLLLIILIRYIKKRSKRSMKSKSQNLWTSKQESFISAQHTWKNSQKSGLTYCNTCSKLIGGFCVSRVKQCIKCNLVCHLLCTLKADNTKCKFVVGTKETAFSPHQWIEGNLPLSSSCSHCGLIAGTYYSLQGFTCLWCQKVVHEDCREKLNDTCDFGKLARAIIRPNFVRYIPKNKQLPKFLLKFQKRIVKPKVDETSESDTDLDNQMKEPSNWKFMVPPSITPIVVVVNKKSGGQVGMEVLREFYRYLNPLQVIDLLEEGLDRLKIFANLPNLKVIACGGDGTVASVVNYIKSCDVQAWQKRNPSVGVLPLGTGNDLARSLGWGGGYRGSDSLRELIVDYIAKSETVMFDRWRVNVKSAKENKKDAQGKQKDNTLMNLVMYNYCSIGLDAKFCLGFHNLREKFPGLFKTQIGNKFIYSHLGANDILQGKRVNLAKICKIICDDKQVFIPDVENIVVVNINSWAGGATNFWPQRDDAIHLSESLSDSKFSSPQQRKLDSFQGGVVGKKEAKLSLTSSSNSGGGEEEKDKEREKEARPAVGVKVDQFKPMSSQDGIIQVIGVTSVLHLGQVQVGMDSPIRICQGRCIEIWVDESGKKQAFQVDGEPFEFDSPFVFQVTLEDQTLMMARAKANGGKKWEDQILRTLEWATNNNTITHEQKDILFEKLLL